MRALPHSDPAAPAFGRRRHAWRWRAVKLRQGFWQAIARSAVHRAERLQEISDQLAARSAAASGDGAEKSRTSTG